MSGRVDSRSAPSARGGTTIASARPTARPGARRSAASTARWSWRPARGPARPPPSSAGFSPGPSASAGRRRRAEMAKRAAERAAARGPAPERVAAAVLGGVGGHHLHRGRGGGDGLPRRPRAGRPGPGRRAAFLAGGRPSCLRPRSAPAEPAPWRLHPRPPGGAHHPRFLPGPAGRPSAGSEAPSGTSQVDADGLLLEGVIQGDRGVLAARRLRRSRAIRTSWPWPPRGFGPREVVGGPGRPGPEGDAVGRRSRKTRWSPERIEELRAPADPRAAEEVLDLIGPLLTSVRIPNAKLIEARLGTFIGRLLEEGPLCLWNSADACRGAAPRPTWSSISRNGDRGSFNDTERQILGEVAGRYPHACRLPPLPPAGSRGGVSIPSCSDHARRALAPLPRGDRAHASESRGIATFDSLLTGAERLLARNPDVRARVRRGIDQLLVDEFQDTDRVQCEILRWLALADRPRAPRPLPGGRSQAVDLRLAQRGSQGLRRFPGAGARGVGRGPDAGRELRSVPAILEEVARTIEPVMRESRASSRGSSRYSLRPPQATILDIWVTDLGAGRALGLVDPREDRWATMAVGQRSWRPRPWRRTSWHSTPARAWTGHGPPAARHERSTSIWRRCAGQACRSPSGGTALLPPARSDRRRGPGAVRSGPGRSPGAA